EAIRHELKKLPTDRIQPKLMQAGIGAVSENDVKTALSSTGAFIFGFNVKVDAQADALAERSGVPIETFDIIYKLTERVDALLAERTPKVETEHVQSSAKVLRLFSKTKDKQVLGARVNTGTFENGALVRIIRKDEEIGRGRVREL